MFKEIVSLCAFIGIIIVTIVSMKAQPLRTNPKYRIEVQALTNACLYVLVDSTGKAIGIAAIPLITGKHC